MITTICLILRIGIILAEKNHSDIDTGREHFEDHWGYKVNWGNREDGWDEKKKKSLIGLHDSISVQQTYVPTFTELGNK